MRSGIGNIIFCSRYNREINLSKGKYRWTFPC